MTINPNSGPPFSFSDVRDLEVCRATSATAPSGQVVIRLERAENISVTSCSAPEASRAEVSGATSRDIVLALNRVPKGVQEVAFADGASATGVEKRA